MLLECGSMASWHTGCRGPETGVLGGETVRGSVLDGSESVWGALPREPSSRKLRCCQSRSMSDKKLAGLHSVGCAVTHRAHRTRVL